MSSGNAHQERLQEELDAAIQENAPTGKLEDAEIQRLVELSNDASFQRSERVPVKTVEAFEPRSLVSIAMAAQRRRETELRTAMAAGAVMDEAVADPAVAEGDERSGSKQAADERAGSKLVAAADERAVTRTPLKPHDSSASPWSIALTKRRFIDSEHGTNTCTSWKHTCPF